jgi:hypothetical protein
MSNKMKIHNSDISKDNKNFKFKFAGIEYVNVEMDLLKNKKKVLEALATAVLFPNNEMVKTFRDTKPKLVEKILPHLQFDKNENADDWELISTSNRFDVAAGTYYVGDLCYDMNDTVYDKIWGAKFNYKSGLYLRKSDGAIFGMFSTGGDGCFKDRNSGEEYCVDAGILGIASAILCKSTQKHVDFYSRVNCCAERGRYIFGHIDIGEFSDDYDD